MEKIYIKILYVIITISTIIFLNICFLHGLRLYYADYNQSIFLKYQPDLGERNIQNYCAELRPSWFPVYFSISFNLLVVFTLLLVIVLVLFLLSKKIVLKKSLMLSIIILLLLSIYILFYTIYTQPEKFFGMC